MNATGPVFPGGQRCSLVASELLRPMGNTGPVGRLTASGQVQSESDMGLPLSVPGELPDEFYRQHGWRPGRTRGTWHWPDGRAVAFADVVAASPELRDWVARRVSSSAPLSAFEEAV